jgi:hypothetical protein
MYAHKYCLLVQKFMILSALILCGSKCGAADSVRKFDAGVFTNNVDYQCVLGGVKKKVVQAVVASCGCTAVDIQKGQVLDESKPFTVRISLDGKPPGVGSQTIRIVFDDNTKTDISIGYDYRPLPSCTPRYLLFGRSDTNIAVAFSFPGEKEAKIVKASCPSFIKHTIGLGHEDNPKQIVATFSCARNDIDDKSERKGVIWIETSSTRMPKFGIPFLLLDH